MSLFDYSTNAFDWAHSRQWDLYRFSAPLVGLVVQFASRPFKKGLANQHDQYLQNVGITDSGQRALFLRIAKDWDLRVTYFATAITTFFSIIAITHAFSGGSNLAFVISVVILVVGAIILYPRIFQNELGRVATPFTAESNTKLGRWLYRKKWTEADLYSYLLRWLNVLLLVLIFLTMPAKATTQIVR